MKNILLCFPTKEDINNIKKYSDYVLKQGMASVIPPCFSLSEIEDENIINQSVSSLVWLCDEMWVFGKTITDEMWKNIHKAKKINVNVRFISDLEEV